MASGYISTSGQIIKGGSVICEESFRRKPYGGLRKIKRLYWFPRSGRNFRRPDLRKPIKIFPRSIIKSAGGFRFRRDFKDSHDRKLMNVRSPVLLEQPIW